MGGVKCTRNITSLGLATVPELCLIFLSLPTRNSQCFPDRTRIFVIFFRDAIQALLARRYFCQFSRQAFKQLIRFTRLAFPDDHDIPPQILETADVLFIPRQIPCKLSLPENRFCLRHACIWTPGVSMPEAPMNKNGGLISPKGNSP